VIDINLQQDTEIVEPPSSSGASRQTGVAEDKGKKKSSAKPNRENQEKKGVPAKQTDDSKASERSSLTDRRADKGYRTQNRDGRDKLEGDAKSQRNDDARRTRSRSSSPCRTGKKIHCSPDFHFGILVNTARSCWARSRCYTVKNSSQTTTDSGGRYHW
jgi:hypothetical protein